ncbi:hypothetical protein ACHAW6_010264 [Cyclotella cf. meneghiniana]
MKLHARFDGGDGIGGYVSFRGRGGSPNSVGEFVVVVVDEGAFHCDLLFASSATSGFCRWRGERTFLSRRCDELRRRRGISIVVVIVFFLRRDRRDDAVIGRKMPVMAVLVPLYLLGHLAGSQRRVVSRAVVVGPSLKRVSIFGENKFVRGGIGGDFGGGSRFRIDGANERGDGVVGVVQQRRALYGELVEVRAGGKRDGASRQKALAAEHGDGDGREGGGVYGSREGPTEGRLA